MPSTRSATRSANSSAQNSPAGSQTKPSSGAGTKRKAEGTPSKAKRGKTGDKAQKTLDETMDIDRTTEEEPKPEIPDPEDTIVDSDAEQAKEQDKAKSQSRSNEKSEETGAEKKVDSEKGANGDKQRDNDANEAKPEEEEKLSVEEEEEAIKAGEEAKKKSEQAEQKPESKPEASSEKSRAKGSTEEVNEAIKKDLDKAEPEQAVEKSQDRAKAQPSNILEKGIIYFFMRGRVGLDNPASVDEIQRSYFILRPLPSGGKITEAAPIGDAGKNRIIALPKKVFPKSRQDKFLCFVEEADSSFENIRSSHLKHSDYATKTQGDRHTPSAKPVAEGIYALTSTGRESHLSYILTVPNELGDVQKDIGLTSRGAFITSVKNPETSSPSYAAPEKRANYPEGIMKDFRGLRWSRLEPAHLDFVDTQFLLIGEGEQDKLEKSVQADQGDGQKEGKEEPLEEMELLEKEDQKRINGLNGDDSDAIFKDLGLNKEEYMKIQTSWE